MFWIAKRKKLHKKIGFIFAVPHTKEQFLTLHESSHSDFLKSLENKYGCSGEDLWNYYYPTALKIGKTISKLKKYGALVIDKASLNSLEIIKDCHAVIIVAHNVIALRKIEFFDRLVSEEEFINSLPPDFKGWLDLSCCSSSRLQSLARIHFQNSDAHIIAPDRKTSINFRMELYPRLIKELIKDNELDYFDALCRVIDHLSSKTKKEADFGIEHLGNSDALSSIFSPKEAFRGETFMVQAFIYKRSDSDDILLIAANQDEDAELRRTFELTSEGKNLRLKRGDEIGIVLKSPNSDNGITIERPSRKTLYWNDDVASAEFFVSVSEDCPLSSFLGRISVYVNRIPVCEANFKIKIISGNEGVHSSQIIQTAISSFNLSKEMKLEHEEIFRKLLNQKSLLESKLNLNSNRTETANIEKDLEICENCINLLLKEYDLINNPKKIVFISSTSDLKVFREVLEEQVKSCDMVPEMYEYWPQRDNSPSDICCAKVLGSDILVCILGAKYGFVKQETGLSMTEMELRCALQAGKPILIYILKDYRDKMNLLLPEHQEDVKKQLNLINKLEEERLIKYITDETSLSTISGRELERVKNTIWNR